MRDQERSPLAIKVCGMREPANVEQVSSLHPEYMGFIFWEGSKRYAGNLPAEVVQGLPAAINRVGVFVNQEEDEILEIANAYRLTHVQLHGEESIQMCKDLRGRGLKVIKAVSIASAADLKEVERYSQDVDMFVFDTKSNASRGGTGKMFDHGVLERYTQRVPFLLSGGISAESAERLRGYTYPLMTGVDVNSRFEIEPGLKDIEKLKTFINKIRQKNEPTT